VGELQLLLCAVLSLLQEGVPTLLHHDAGVANLLGVLDHRHAAHHEVLAELVQRLKVEVVKPLVPVPSVVALPCGEADRLRGLKVEDVEATGSMVHLDKKTSVTIPDAKHALVSLHLGPTFIELPQAHDGVAQRRDEVDAMKDSVVAVLGLEHDGADALDLHL
jgi:hypothetical protein